MLKKLLITVLAVVLLAPTIPQIQAEVYDTKGNLYYVLIRDANINDDGGPLLISLHKAGAGVSPTSGMRPGWTFLGWRLYEGGDYIDFSQNSYPIVKNTHMVHVWQNDTTGEISPRCKSCADPACPGGCGTTLPPGPIVIPSHNDPAASYIDLTAETITLPFTSGAYSLNGGKSWKVGALPSGAAFSKLLGKGITLWVAEGYDKSTKKPTGKVVNFPRIERGPKANPEKMKPTHIGDGEWELTPKASLSYEFAPTSNGKTPSGAWEDFDGKLAQNGTAKKVYLMRVKASMAESSTAAPAVYTPAGKVFKVTLKKR